MYRQADDDTKELRKLRVDGLVARSCDYRRASEHVDEILMTGEEIIGNHAL